MSEISTYKIYEINKINESIYFNLSNPTNTPVVDENISRCNVTVNPWCEKFGVQQIIEVIYLSILTVLAFFGNLLVIFSIILEKKVHRNANVFIINLAFADFLVSLLKFILKSFLLKNF